MRMRVRTKMMLSFYFCASKSSNFTRKNVGFYGVWFGNTQCRVK